MKFFALFLVVLTLVGSAMSLKDSICNLDHSANGDGKIACAAFMPKWSYNSATNECVSFIYGGCGGNENRFASQAICEEKCKD